MARSKQLTPNEIAFIKDYATNIGLVPKKEIADAYNLPYYTADRVLKSSVGQKIFEYYTKEMVELIRPKCMQKLRQFMDHENPAVSMNAIKILLDRLDKAEETANRGVSVSFPHMQPPSARLYIYDADTNEETSHQVAGYEPGEAIITDIEVDSIIANYEENEVLKKVYADYTIDDEANGNDLYNHDIGVADEVE